jgi:hypothetical protein
MADGSTVERAGLVLPSIPELSKLPTHIDAEDEREIRSFLENPSVATITQSSGAFGGQLERAEAFGYGALPCRRCGGRWRSRVVFSDELGRDVELVTRWRDGTGRQPKKRIGKGGKRESYAAALARYRVQQRLELKIVLTAYPTPSTESGVDAAALWDAMVDSYWERGEALMTEQDFREAFPALPDEWTEPCTPCEGLGVVPRRHPNGFRREEVTVWPKGSSVRVGGHENLDADGLVAALADGDVHDGRALVRFDALAAWLATARILRDVETLSPIAREGIERLYAPRESRSSWGRLGLIDLAGSASKVGALQDHLSQAWNFCAYGAAS